MIAPFNPVVVAPTYNNDRSILEILNRIEATKLPVIVVNDGSDDSTAGILASWQSRCPAARTESLARRLKTVADPTRLALLHYLAGTPSTVGDLVTAGKAKVKVLRSPDSWFGVTYREDRPRVIAKTIPPRR